MKLSLYIVITVGVIILLLFLMLVTYLLDIGYAYFKNRFFSPTNATESSVNVFFENVVKNSVLCGLKEELKNALKEFCSNNNVQSVQARSGKYGTLMEKAGSKYIQNLISEIDQSVVNQCIAGRILSLKGLIVQFEDTISAYTIYNKSTIQCELQRILYIRLLLDNILKLARNICVQNDIELMEMYCLKFKYSLSFYS